jgi:hypothetical protein
MKDFIEFSEIFKKNLLAKKPSTQIIEWQKEGVLKRHLLALDRCVGIHQDPKFHQDDVFTHCVKTCDNTPPDIVLRWAGILHDTGKYDVRSWHILCRLYLPDKRIIQYCRIKGKKCFKRCDNAIERITFYRHEIASERIAKKVLKRYKVPFEEGRAIVDLISNHMYNYTSDWSEKALNRFIKANKLTKADLIDWQKVPIFQLRMADRISRDLEPITQKQLDFIERLRGHFDELV